MWKRLLVLPLLMQWNLITSQPAADEKTDNIRATRQLNFGDCCPCPEQDASQDRNTALILLDAASGDNSCPCRAQSDTEGASSIFRPAFRAVEPFMSPVPKKEDPKPLLDPEVGLASSVLETLREVTDQEYQEALVRDAAKSVLKLMDPGLPETQPKNQVHIIVSPKDENNDDTISEASEIQGSSCIPPPLSMYNNLEHLRLHSPKKLLKQILSPPIFKSKAISNRNRNDMDGSASNNQELVLQPLKSNLFENMKTRLNSLNLRPLSKIDNREFLTSPKIPKNHYLKNNIRDRMQLRNKPLEPQIEQPRTLTETLTKKSAGFKEPIDNSDTTVLLKKNKSPVEANALRNTDCSDTIAIPKGTLEDNREDLDVFPSPSKVIQIKSPEILENSDVIEPEKEADTCIDEELDTDTEASDINPSIFQTVSENHSFPKSNEVATEVNPVDANIKAEQSDDYNTTEKENIVDMESKPSSTKSKETDLQHDANVEETSFTEDETKIRNADSQNSKELKLTPEGEKEKMATSRTQTLPNIKADILRTLENFKKANEKIQEKLRSNVQDALQLVVTNKPHDSLPQTATETYSQSEMRAPSMEQPKNDNYFTSITSENNIDTQELDNISQSLLEPSSSKEDTETSAKFDCGVDLNEKSAEVNKKSANDDMIISQTSLDEISHPKPFEDEKERMSTEDLQKMSDSLLERSTLKNDDEMTSMQLDKNENNLKEKAAEVDKVFDDMITSPTSFEEKKYPKTFRDGNADFHSKDDNIISFKSDEVERNVCGYNDMPKITGSTNMKNEGNEMITQPSNSVFNHISQPDLSHMNFGSIRDFAVKPNDNIKPMEGIKDFFNSFTALGRDTFTDDDGDSKVLTNQGLFGFSSNENMASSKGFTRGDPYRFNSDTNLNYFKAKVASPKSLDIGSLVPTLSNSDDKDDVLGSASQSIQRTTNLKNVIENNLKKGFNPLFKAVPTPKLFEGTFSSLAPRLSDGFKSHTNNMKTFRESLDVVGGDPFNINKNNLIGKQLINPDDFFGAVLKTRDDFHDRLQAFHSDLNRRFSSITPRISSLGETQLLGTPSRLKSPQKKAELLTKNTATKPFSKNMLLSRNRPTLESIKDKLSDTESKSSNFDLLPNNKQMSGIIQRPNSGLKKGTFTFNPSRSYGSTKIPTKNNMKLKPLKENKVTISFATTTIRPDTLKFRSAGSSKWPKLAKILKDNKLKASKLESKDPKVSPSEISISRAQLPDTLKKSKAVPNISSIEESEFSLDSNQNDDNRHSTGISEANKKKDLLLSKIKNAFASRTSSDDTRRKNKVLSSKKNENILDATQSASANIEASISATDLIGDTLKDHNRSFQCKMVCIKDILDST